MTYQEFCEELRNEFKEKRDIYLEMEIKISQINVSADLNVLGDYEKAKEEWQIAKNDYFDFLADIKNKTVNLYEEIIFELI